VIKCAWELYFPLAELDIVCNFWTSNKLWFLKTSCKVHKKFLCTFPPWLLLFTKLVNFQIPIVLFSPLPKANELHKEYISGGLGKHIG
jgi:hypothetical protein